MLQFVQDGLFKAELNEFLTRELAEDGYSGVEVRVTPTRTEIIILATRTQNVLGEKGRRIRELTSVVQKRYNFPEGTVEVSCRLFLVQPRKFGDSFFMHIAHILFLIKIKRSNVMIRSPLLFFMK